MTIIRLTPRPEPRGRGIVPHVLGEEKQRRIGQPDDVLQFAPAELRVLQDRDGAKPDAGKKGRGEVGGVGHPEHDLVAGLDAELSRDRQRLLRPSPGRRHW